ncbi:MAG: hypothetical protein UW63_C0054G0005 [Candidatus Uhrbacteria bacterium GW2011_GWF2_44_350]|uniref:Uncharacterized protein n=1 Tax=Candidatus Uhrbacteria bacterium GW2011_GWF2_44_350 TaxID=1619000 RepID=A0A0G1JE01_9BACT|nr:MAG: hypothetical protein UW63_C0054G0005 [Candidatus Uhrbacteria bacterium GW2011_GWF2_44_350]
MRVRFPLGPPRLSDREPKTQDQAIPPQIYRGAGFAFVQMIMLWHNDMAKHENYQ